MLLLCFRANDWIFAWFRPADSSSSYYLLLPNSFTLHWATPSSFFSVACLMCLRAPCFWGMLQVTSGEAKVQGFEQRWAVASCCAQWPVLRATHWGLFQAKSPQRCGNLKCPTHTIVSFMRLLFDYNTLFDFFITAFITSL
jgi:hypothetical protein